MQRKKNSNFFKSISESGLVCLFRAGMPIPVRTKFTTFFFSFLCFIIFLSNLSFSNDQWINYTNTSVISCLALEGNYLWQGSPGGAVRRNLDDPLNGMFYYNRANGLAENGVRFIEVDHLSKKWFSTFSGITVWDGATSITYDTMNSGLVGNFADCLAEDKSGRMWIMNYGVATVFNGTNWTTYDSINSGLFTKFYGVAIDDSNRVWFYG